MSEQSSLDRLLAAQGCPGLDELILKICEGCFSEKACKQGKMSCKAMEAILGMASKFSAQNEIGKASIRSYFKNLKAVVNQ
ncbi:hypothetical protein K8R62_04150 [bacterium]|nr:hypothetical protein [bacterium]